MLRGNRISITKTYQTVKGKEIIGPPKTFKGNRIVNMPDRLCDEMKDYFEMCYDKKSTRAFATTKYSLHKAMTRGSKRAGVKRIRIHDLRHSHISLLISLGFSAVDIAKRVGHESITITLRYIVQTNNRLFLDKYFFQPPVFFFKFVGFYGQESIKKPRKAHK